MRIGEKRRDQARLNRVNWAFDRHRGGKLLNHLVLDAQDRKADGGTITLDSSELSSGEELAVKTLTIKGAGGDGEDATYKVLATNDMEIGDKPEDSKEPGEYPDEPYEDPEDTFDDDPEGLNGDGNDRSSDRGIIPDDSSGGDSIGYCNTISGFGGGVLPSLPVSAAAGERHVLVKADADLAVDATRHYRTAAPSAFASATNFVSLTVPRSYTPSAQTMPHSSLPS